MEKRVFPALLCSIAIIIISSNGYSQQSNINNEELYRPQIHFSPQAHWINDPNGMVFYKGTYHLFYQYYPGGTVWGPMHWGHATSKDIVHWKHEPIALYPDSLGYIFSGSVVADKNNTSGLGTKNNPPLIAIFTHHDTVGEKAGRNDYQNQSIAYSIDDGKTWIKYADNPVLKNPGITDFRDPKVIWYEPENKWVMTLATKDHITFYSSKNLKQWTKESEFGASLGAHGGVWECPDLFTLDNDGKKVWVLIVNINPGGPNKGSATQYFLGDFDGKTFIPSDTKTKWLDYGPDEYAGVTWSNTGERKIFLGWMSNWLYANVVPTEKWRNAMTIPRELQLIKEGNETFISSRPVTELSRLQSKPVVTQNMQVEKSFNLSNKVGKIKLPCRMNVQIEGIKDFSFLISNDAGDELVLGFDKSNDQYYIDRTRSGKTDFQQDFGARHTVPRFTSNSNMNLTLIIDISSIELFADDGLSVMTEIFFPNKPFDKIEIQTSEKMMIKKLEYFNLKSIW